jgi:hypothetical protein
MVELTENERAALVIDFDGLGEKALQLINEQAERIHKLEVLLDLCSSNFDAMCEQRDIADVERDRADAAESQLLALRARVDKAIQILSNQGIGTWYAVPALEALRG